MKEVYQIPRTSLAWILGSLVAVILPHLARMPLWLTALCASCITTRIFIFQGRLSYPGSKIKVGIVLITLAAVIVQYGRDIFSTDATVGVLIIGIALKLLEMHQKRDVLMVIYLCYFTIVAEFIYSQSIPVAIYMGFCVLLITSALMSLTQTQEYQRPLRTFKLSALILAQSVPLMLVLFLLFPRIPPLWSVPLQTSSAVTGLSETMSPGDIGDLTRVGDIVFRVKFKTEPLPNQELYWRGLTLDIFNGRQWRRRTGYSPELQYLNGNRREPRDWFGDIEYQGNISDYNVIMEATFQNWLFTLKIPSFSEEGLVMRRDYQVESIRKITQRYTYDARSYLDNRVGLVLAPDISRDALRLPDTGNEESRAFAWELRDSVDSELDYIQAVLNYFRQEPFFYTLSPALLGDNSIDEFLFDSREGFCEHYASAFSFLMRAGGIPARVVTGYQGGEFNPYDDTLVVRQYDAHAWSEVWLQGQGWIRVDPTAAVAPQRINLGSQLTFQEDENFLGDVGFSMLRFRNSLLLNDLRLRLEMMDYAWNRWVLNYDRDLQFELFSQLFGTVTQKKILYTLVGLLLAFVAIAAFFVLKKPARKELRPATALYLHYCDFLAKLGFERNSGETPQNYCSRVAGLQPQWANEMSGITETYVDLAFRSKASDLENADKIKRLQRKIKKFRLMN